MSNLVIVSGCWQHQQQPIHRECVSNICREIDGMQDVAAILISADHARLDSAQHDPTWLELERRYFKDEQGITWMREQYAIAVRERQNFTNYVDLEVCNHAFPCNERVAISKQWQIWYLLEHVYTKVDTVWYFGIGWNLGMRRDPIGWGHLIDLLKHAHISRPIQIRTCRSCVLVNVDVFDKPCVDSRFDYPEFDSASCEHQDVYVISDTNWDPSDKTSGVPKRYWPR